MEYLGIKPHRPKIGVFDFTGCEGCELQLANKEETIEAFLQAIEIVNFREVSSSANDQYEIAFIDGAISRADEVERLKKIRKNAKILVAMGSCACFGGVSQLKNSYDLEAANTEVYGDRPKETDLVRPASHYVKVDLSIPGCPVSKKEIERITRHVIMGLPFKFPVYPVCVECKQLFNTCLFELGHLCLGAITRAGCEAPCPSNGLPCYGCRGPAEDCNLSEFYELAARHGFDKVEIEERVGFFGGFEELRCKLTST